MVAAIPDPCIYMVSQISLESQAVPTRLTGTGRKTIVAGLDSGS